MATGKVDVNILDVGQGQATFVEIYDDDATPNVINTILFDLGSENNSDTAGKPSADYIVGVLQDMDSPAKIGLLVLSHKDADHVNLLPYLLSHFKKSELVIDKVIFSGRADWYPKGLFTKLSVFTTSIKPLPIMGTSYNKTTKKFPAFYSSDEVNVYLIAANTPESSEKRFSHVSHLPATPQANAANTKSIVCMIEYEDDQFIIMGDATYKTISAINTHFKGKEDLFPTVKMLTLPHHGSRKTTFGLSSTDAAISAKKTETIDTFVELTKPESLTVSADRKFYHPSLETIEAFWTYVSDDDPWYTDPELKDDRHSITAALDIPLYFPDGSDTEYDYYSFQTTVNVYSTLYSLGVDEGEFSYPPAEYIYKTSGSKKKKRKIESFPELPEGVMWYYSITATTFDLDRYDNRDAIAPAPFMAKASQTLTAKRTTPKKDRQTHSPLAIAASRSSTRQAESATLPLPAQRAIHPSVSGEARSLHRMKAFR